MDLVQQLRYFISRYQTLGWLLVLTGAGLLAQGLLYVVLNLSGRVDLFLPLLEKLVLPWSFGHWVKQPWSLLTYPFFQLPFSAFGLLFDGLILWTFAQIHQQMLGEQRTRRLSILAVPLVGLLTLLLSSLIGFEASEGGPPQGSPVAQEVSYIQEAALVTPFRSLLFTSGLSPLIAVLMISCITLVPTYPIRVLLFGQVKIVWVGVALFVLSLMSANFTPKGVAILAGGLLGLTHVLLLRSGYDLTESLWEGWDRLFRRGRPQMKVKMGGTAPQAKQSGSRNEGVSQEVIDQILDKINARGYDSLSREEKEILYHASRSEDERKR